MRINRTKNGLVGAEFPFLAQNGGSFRGFKVVRKHFGQKEDSMERAVYTGDSDPSIHQVDMVQAFLGMKAL